MAITEPRHHLEIRDDKPMSDGVLDLTEEEAAFKRSLRDHRRNVLWQERHEASLVKPGNVHIDPPYPIEGVDDKPTIGTPESIDPEDLCDCGGEYDEDGKCDSCRNGHQDCEIQECQPCYERLLDRYEDREI